MKLIIILVLSLLNLAARASASCPSAIEGLSDSYLGKLVAIGVSKPDALREVNFEFEEAKLYIQQLVEWGVSERHAVIIATGDGPLSLNSVKVRFEEVKQHIEELIDLGIPAPTAVDRASMEVSPFSKFAFDNRKTPQFEQVKKEFAELIRLGFSSSLALTAVTRYSLKDGSFPFTFYEKSLGFSKEETAQLFRAIIESDPRPTFFPKHPSRDALMILSRRGFTNAQIIQMVELGAVTSISLWSYLKFSFGIASPIIKNKKDQLRQAGFTEEEINRMSPPELSKGEQLTVLLGIGGIGAAGTLLVDGAYWLSTGNSFLW